MKIGKCTVFALQVGRTSAPLVWMLVMKLHRHREGMKWFITTRMKLSEESRAGSQAGFKMVWKTGSSWWLGGLPWLVRGHGMRVPTSWLGLTCFEVPAGAKGRNAWALLSHVGWDWKREGWGLKAVSSPNIKTKIKLFIKILENIKSLRLSWKFWDMILPAWDQ